jgi:glycosyltransferase involved in cell wall biosynthesis
MRLIIPVEFYRKGGVERVILALIGNLTHYVEEIVLVLPSKEIDYFRSILPDSKNIIYESFSWTNTNREYQFILILTKILSVAQKLNLKTFQKIISDRIRNLRIQSRINFLAQKHRSTHCLYVLINRLRPPNIQIPLIGISYDLFWRFAPLTYSDSYVSEYDRHLLMWLEKAAIIFTISQRTRQDILSVFPDSKFVRKITAVPLAGFPDNSSFTPDRPSDPDPPIFYFPSSFSIYKDHLTLLKATLKLTEKNLDFKVILLGKETDSLVNGSLKLSQQLKTQEYADYLYQCSELYRNNKSLFEKYIEGLGYCSYEQVEYWYNNCSCVVVPSQYEGFGLAVSEAIVRGLPVIASALDVFNEQAELYQCFDRIEFFPQGNVDALADRMEQFILNPKQKLRSEEVNRRFSHWTWQDVAKQYVTLLEKIPSKQ